MNSPRASLYLLLPLLAGCAAEPFIRPPLPPLLNPDPPAVRAAFARTLPPHFVSDDTVIIQAPFHDDLAVLGVLRVDRPAGTFELLALNPLGVKFFQVGGSPQDAAVHYAAPPLESKKEILLSIARDTRRIYFDLLPDPAARVDLSPTIVRFTQHTPDGNLVYEFGGQPTVLLEKRLEGFWGTIWRIRYYDYAPAPGSSNDTPDETSGDTSGGTSGGGALYPRGIVMDNARYHYRIIVKNREWRPQ